MQAENLHSKLSSFSHNYSFTYAPTLASHTTIHKPNQLKIHVGIYISSEFAHQGLPSLQQKIKHSLDKIQPTSMAILTLSATH